MAERVVQSVWEPEELLASAARTATVASAAKENPGARGVLVTLDVTVGTTLSLTISIRYRDPITGKNVALVTAAAAVTGVGTTTIAVVPGGAAGGAITDAVDIALPKDWDVNVVHGNANSATYQVSASYLA